MDYFADLNLASQQQAAARENLYLVDFEKLAWMAHNRSWVNAEDGTHYMCGGYPAFDQHWPLSQLKAFRGSVKAYNCDDPVNAALVEAIVAGLSSVQKSGRPAGGGLPEVMICGCGWIVNLNLSVIL